MNAIDPRELSDRELLSRLLFGDLPRPGWPGRRRAMAGRILAVAVQALLAVLILVALLGLIVLVAASQDLLLVPA